LNSLACAFPPCSSGTTLRSLFIVVSRPVPQPLYFATIAN
jgi:hypothetical protein